MALIDRIKYDGDGGGWLIHKYPGEEFVLGSQLIVNEGQEAVFFKGGAAHDLFKAGTHTLRSKNLPLLGKLVKFPFGGKTPFSAEVYYVNKTARLDMNWGTAEPFQTEDPKYGIILSIRSYGSYGIRINDGKRFVSELVGAIPHGSTLDHTFVSSYFSGLLTTSVKTAVSSFMNGKKVSFLEITSYLEELSAECMKRVAPEFQRFGAELTNFYIKSISPPKEDYEKLKGYKDELSMGEGFYRERRSFDVMEAMASGNGGEGAANAGIGIGMGMGIAPVARELFSGIGGAIGGGDRGNDGDKISCPHCGAKLHGGQKFCGECGGAIGTVCPSCGKVNEAGQRFCGECGARLLKKCPSCGSSVSPDTKFCGECGAKL